MPRRPQTPALKGLQYLLRGFQLTCSVIILSLNSYILSALSNHGLSIATWLRAAEGIAGITIAYTIACILSLRFSPHVGRLLAAFGTMAMDVIFASAAIYVASTYGYGGVDKCAKDEVDGPFGKGKPDEKPESDGDGFVSLPTFGDACRIGSAGLAVSVILIFLFIGSVFTELWIGRNFQRDRRLNVLNPPGEYDNSKLGGAPTFATTSSKKSGFLGRLFSRRRAAPVHPDNVLPEHAHPEPVMGGAANSTTLGTIRDDDRQPLTRLSPQPPTPGSPQRPDYFDGHGDDGDLGRPEPPSYQPLAYPPHAAPHGRHLQRQQQPQPQQVPYGEVPNAGGDLGYGMRSSVYGGLNRPPQHGPYLSTSPYDDDDDQRTQWRPNERYDTGGRQNPALGMPTSYRYDDGVYDRP